MSDFDKEKEREKLREKYENEQESRETAEKMSELLLQGATMTNAHCSACGDPIFRYDGQEFCATCEKPVDRDTGDAEADDGDEETTDARADAGDTETIEVTSPSDDARVQFGDGDDQPPAEPADTEPSAESQSAAETADRAQAQGTGPQSPQRRPDSQQRVDPPTDRHREAPGTSAPRAGDVSAARESLVRTLSRFSEQAERCEDPQRAREYLAAAREAAEALSALRR